MPDQRVAAANNATITNGSVIACWTTTEPLHRVRQGADSLRLILLDEEVVDDA